MSKLADDDKISFKMECPKKRGSAAFDRYEKYKVAKTVGEALRLGAQKGDLKYDQTKGFLKKESQADAAQEGGAAPAPPPAPPPVAPAGAEDANQQASASPSGANPAKAGSSSPSPGKGSPKAKADKKASPKIGEKADKKASPKNSEKANGKKSSPPDAEADSSPSTKKRRVSDKADDPQVGDVPAPTRNKETQSVFASASSAALASSPVPPKPALREESNPFSANYKSAWQGDSIVRQAPIGFSHASVFSPAAPSSETPSAKVEAINWQGLMAFAPQVEESAPAKVEPAAAQVDEAPAPQLKQDQAKMEDSSVAKNEQHIKPDPGVFVQVQLESGEQAKMEDASVDKDEKTIKSDPDAKVEPTTESTTTDAQEPQPTTKSLREQEQEVDLSFATLDGKPVKFVKRVMGEARKILSAAGQKDSEVGGYTFKLLDKKNLAKWAVTVRDLNPTGKLAQDLKKEGLDESIDLEISLPDGYPLEPPFVRLTYPKLKHGFVFTHGGICFEPLTPKGWAPSMTLPSLMISIKGILDWGDVRLAEKGDVAARRIKEYTEEGARRDTKMIDSAHRGGEGNTYGSLSRYKA